jgi:hypothetical protein
MRKMILVGAALLVLATANRASALGTVNEYTDQQSHPLKVAAIALSPIGFTLEWLIFRPLHQLTAQEDLAPIFGQQEDPYRQVPYGTSQPRGMYYRD